eukprot:TRINITY_DN31926_c0_g1_i1.p1 TRINITY_DN31926_c0_g1~~TRINITY_DN31926_c0_g1_i1.p1  ORF type:complete len:172 (-),score=13.82 TRINITY_DN31926_c0_g1_i1:383-898(-)
MAAVQMSSSCTSAMLAVPNRKLDVRHYTGLAANKSFSPLARFAPARASAVKPMASKLTVRADSDYRRGGGGGDFFAGFILGGAVFGALGYLFAPQISKAILGVTEDVEGGARTLPKWISESDSLEEKRRKMNEKLAELNRAIDKTSAELKGSDFPDGRERRNARVDSIEAI